MGGSIRIGRPSRPGVISVIACLTFLPLAISAAELPALTGRVVDNANLIDEATQTALTSKLEAFEKKTSIQIVVATILGLDGEAIEPFANRLFRAWGLGQAQDNSGALLLVAKDDRKMRIEVGYGLEGTLTDLHSKLIIENVMAPAFREGDFTGGISRAADQIINVLEGNADELTPPDYGYDDNSGSDIDPIFVLFILIWGVLFLGGFALATLPPLFGRKIGPNRYRWLGMDFNTARNSSSSSGGSGWSSGSSSGGWSSGSSGSGGGGYSGGGGSSGGGGASGSW